MHQIGEYNFLNTDFSCFIDSSIEQLFSDEKWKAKKLGKVAEVTYSYHLDTGINITLFVDGGGLDLETYIHSNIDEKSLLFNKAYAHIEKILQEKLSEIKNTQQELSETNIKKEEDIIKTEILNNALTEKYKLLQYALLALPIEKQKAGYKIDLNNTEFKNLEQNLSDLDRELFGGDIKENPDEVQVLYSGYTKRYNENKDKISNQEQIRMEHYLSKVGKYLPEGYMYQTPKVAQKIDDDFLQTKLSREQYIPIFNHVLQGLKNTQHIAKVNPDVLSATDGPTGVDFPNTKSFETLTIERILTLSNHELECHCVSDYNSQILLGSLRGAGSTLKDEGVAVLMEQILLYGEELYTQKDGKTVIDINKLNINPAYIEILMCECLDNNELKDFLEISHKLTPGNISPEERYFRLKRNNYNNGQHKDTLYLRGLLQVVQSINDYILSDGKKGLSINDLFLGKVSIAETPLLRRLLNIKSNSEKDKNIVKPIQPMFIAETIYYLLKNNIIASNGKIDRTFSKKDLLQHLQQKYPIINITENIFDHITYTTNRSIFRITKIFNDNKFNLSKKNKQK